MSGQVEAAAADVTPPIEGRVRVVAVTSTSQAVALADVATSGDFLTLHAEGGDVFLVFGTSSSVTAHATATTGNTRSWRIAKDRSEHFRIASDHSLTHVAAITSAGTATLRYYRS